LEVAGLIEDFIKAVRAVPELEWLGEVAVDAIAPDDDFYIEEDEGSTFPGRLFLLGADQRALNQLLALWARYQADPTARFPQGLNKFRNVFGHLIRIRPWDVRDRIDEEVRAYWAELVEEDAIRFEIEAWFSTSDRKNEQTAAEIERLTNALGGRVVQRLLLPDILYHGFLVEVPGRAIRETLDGEIPGLALSDRIMFFRPKAQSVTEGLRDIEASPAPEVATPSDWPPVVALFDGMPLQNHSLLLGRLAVDDPDGWEEGYEAKDRVHGTVMASLVLHGELDGTDGPLRHRLYVRPILRPNPNDNINERRVEHTPDNVLLIDLVHRAVKRLFDDDGQGHGLAPSVRVVNLSVGNHFRVFAKDLCPWARLLDWLSWRYNVLFIVSAGNRFAPFRLELTRAQFAALDAQGKAKAVLAAMVAEGPHRRLIAPAEAINVVTVGASHEDNSQFAEVAGRFDLFERGGVSPLSRIGHGFKRAVKPELLAAGGRVLHMEQMGPEGEACELKPLDLWGPPGQRAAVPPLLGQPQNQTAHSRGTSNATALTSRTAARIYESLEEARRLYPNAPPIEFDAVLLKALLVHGASWRNAARALLAERPDLQEIENAAARRAAEKDYLGRWLGYGFLDPIRSVACSAERATVIGVAEIGDGEAVRFSMPLPPTLAGKVLWRRLTLTLAWMSPINCASQAYRRARLWVTPNQTALRVTRKNGVHEKAAIRGTLQHEVLEGEQALAFADGNTFECEVHCMADAGGLEGSVRFALCVSLEVAEGAAVPVYQEIRDRIALQVPVRAA
jgi:hypothetical protein